MFLKKLLPVFFLLLFFGSAFADGMVIDSQSMPRYQNYQEAFINNENGTENLFIMVNLRDAMTSGEKAVWIFPVPANPEQIQIDNLKGFPVLGGKEIKQQATENVLLLEAYMAAAAFPPFGIFGLLFFMTGAAPMGGMRTMDAAEKGISVPGLDIYQHIDKFGIATEVVKGTDAAVFKNYLAARGTNLSSGAEQFLQEYMGKDYSFIVSWISDRGAIEQDNYEYDDYYYGNYNQNPIGVLIKFPSENIYYPLKPTAYYGNQTMPVVINIAGFKEPAIFSNIKEKTTTGHYYTKFLSHTIDEEASLRAVFNGSLPETLNYTKISINTQANYFTEDLFFSTNESIGAHALNLINQSWLFWMLLLFFCLAFAAIFLANRLMNLNLNHIDMAIIAAANFLTVFIAGLAIGLMKKQKFGIKEKDDVFGKKFIVLLVFEAIFFGFAVMLFALTILGLVFFH